MSKKYFRFMASSRGIHKDDDCAFEVAEGQVITYSVEEKGFLRKEFIFHALGSTPITKETTVKVELVGGSGSGVCNIRTGEEYDCCHVYEEAEAFAAEIRREIDRAPA